MSLQFTLKFRMNENIPGRNSQEDSILFEERFSRCCPLLHFLAFRILGSDEEAEEAVQSCRITASRNPPRFQYEGAFRGWLVRVLMDEALAVLRQRKAAIPLSVDSQNRKVVLDTCLGINGERAYPKQGKIVARHRVTPADAFS
jgi:DNA-directed RNA polymerase specialized sigma24 family protein